MILPSIIARAGDTARMIVKKEAVALGRLNECVPPSPFVLRLLDMARCLPGAMAPTRGCLG